MKFYICAMKDEMNGFSVPQFHNSQKFLERSFREAVTTVPELRIHARDLSYYLLGEFDVDTGIITSFEPKKLIDGAALVRSEDVK